MEDWCARNLDKIGPYHPAATTGRRFKLMMERLIFRGISQERGAPGPALVLEGPGAKRILHLGLEQSDLPLLCRALHREGCGRQSVFGVVQGLLQTMNATDVGIGLDLTGEGTLVATIRFEQAGKTTSLPCRPVEAVLLAVRLGAPIFASSRLAQEVDQTGEPLADPERTQRVREWLARVRPEDFQN